MSDLYPDTMVTLEITRVVSALGVALNNTNVDSVSLIITDADDGTVLQEEDDATWSAALAGWYYDWDVTGVDPGRYIAEVHINSVSGPPSGIKFLPFRLARSPVPVLVP